MNARYATGRSAEFCVWFVLVAIVSVLLARVAVWLQWAGYGSVVLPTVIGGALGATAIALAGGARRSIRVQVGAAIAALVCVAAQHVFFYVQYRTQFAESVASNAKLQLIQAAGEWTAPSFRQFLDASAQWSPEGIPSWLWWTIHAALTIVAAVAAAWFLGRSAKSPATLGNP